MLISLRMTMLSVLQQVLSTSPLCSFVKDSGWRGDTFFDLGPNNDWLTDGLAFTDTASVLARPSRLVYPGLKITTFWIFHCFALDIRLPSFDLLLLLMRGLIHALWNERSILFYFLSWKAIFLAHRLITVSSNSKLVAASEATFPHIPPGFFLLATPFPRVWVRFL